MNEAPKQVGYLVLAPRGSSAEERWQLRHHPSGDLSNSFHLGATRDDVVEILRRAGFNVRGDNTVWR